MSKNLEKLMLKREQFPVLAPVWGGDYYVNPQIPPIHGSIVENEINLDLVLPLPDGVKEGVYLGSVLLVNEALENTVLDLKDVKEKATDRFDVVLGEESENVSRDSEGKIKYGVAARTEAGITIRDVPFVGPLSVYNNKIAFGSGESLSIYKNAGSRQTLLCTAEISFPDELMKEYGLKTENILHIQGHKDYKRIDETQPCNWYSHNLTNEEKIFLKNFIIELDNVVVREKYSQ